MNHCKQCGAELPDEAKFCFQCGTPTASSPEIITPAEPQKELKFLEPAVAGGLFLGLLSSLPLISAGNCLCCMWVIGGGALSTFLLTKQRPTGISYGDGAFGGVLSGLFGAVVATLVNIPMRLLSAQFFQSQQDAMEESFARYPEISDSMKEAFRTLVSPEINALTIGFTFMMHVVLFALFAMIGGILMVAILEKRKSRAL